MKTRVPRTFLVVTALTLGFLPAPSSAQGQQPSGDKPKARVLMGGSGTEPQIQTAIDDLADFLKSEGVAVEVEPVGKARSALAQQLKETGGDSVLYMSYEVARNYDHVLTAQCFDAEGKELWEERSKSGSALHKGNYREALEKMKNKIRPRLGQPGLLKWGSPRKRAG